MGKLDTCLHIYQVVIYRIYIGLTGFLFLFLCKDLSESHSSQDILFDRKTQSQCVSCNKTLHPASVLASFGERFTGLIWESEFAGLFIK